MNRHKMLALLIVFIFLMSQGILVTASSVLVNDHFDIDGYLDPSTWHFTSNSSGAYWEVDDSNLIIHGGYTNGGGGQIRSTAMHTIGDDKLIFEMSAKKAENDTLGGWGFWDDGESSVLFFTDSGDLVVNANRPSCHPSFIRLDVDRTLWHTYRIEVTGSLAEFYVDGNLEATISDCIPQLNPMPIYLDQGSWGQDQTLTVDYIRLTAVSPTLSVNIDIKPGSTPNAVNPKNKGVIPVAILSTNDFDPALVDTTSVVFGPNEAEPKHNGHVEDVDGDGDSDLVFHFPANQTGIVCGDTEATLSGSTLAGQTFSGVDSIKTVGCK